MHDRRSKIFFPGIAGSGVSAIALFLADMGHSVYGSDRAFDANSQHPLRSIFRCKGITVVPQDGNGIDDTFDLVVFSAAVEPDRPEIVKARTLGIPIKSRSEYLAEISASFNTVAVAGTSGKSTASGLLSFLMKRLGLDPSFLGGGRVKQFRSCSNPGNVLKGNSDNLVIEACESDGLIAGYKPRHSIILNLDFDHHAVDKTGRMFEELMKNTPGKVIVNSDDINLSKITDENAITFSIQTPSPYRPESVTYKPFGTDFSLRGTGFTLSLPGEHNLYNALSCIAFLLEIGISPADVSKILHEFQGIERRFDVHLNDGERLVVDDYAHNPHKISSLMKTVKRMKKRICYIFQPHGFGPTKLMRKEYITAFVQNLREADRLILLPIYYAGGTARKDISSRDLADGITAGGRSAEVVERREDILERVHEFGTYVVFGARDESLSDFAGEIARALSVQPFLP